MVKGSVELDLVNVGDFFSSHCLGKQLHIVGLITFCALKHPFSFVAILTTFLFFSSDMYTVPLPVFLCCHFCNPALLCHMLSNLCYSVFCGLGAAVSLCVLLQICRGQCIIPSIKYCISVGNSCK